MSIPYRKPPRASSEHCAAFVQVLRGPATSGTGYGYYGGLLLIDGRGQPLEFVHNTLDAPSGFLWPEQQVQALATTFLCHSLFEACRRDPELLVCTSALGALKFIKTEIGVSIPFAQVVEIVEKNRPSEWNWINDPPTPGMAAHALGETLRNRGFAVEPFQRIIGGLAEMYPDIRSAE